MAAGASEPETYWRGSAGERMDLDLVGSVLVGFSLHRCHTGRADLARARFHRNAVLNTVEFHGDAVMRGVQFHREAFVAAVQFHGNAVLTEARFPENALLGGAQFRWRREAGWGALPQNRRP